MTHARFLLVPPPRQRRGVAVVMVLLMVVVTLAVTYSLARLQTQEIRLRANSDRTVRAKMAAYSGMSIALERMRTPEWTGADSSQREVLTDTESCLIEYRTGDDRASPDTMSEDDRKRYPYRVTVRVTGKSAERDAAANLSEYRLRAVVELVPKASCPQDSRWTQLTPFSVCQYTYGVFSLGVPAKISGRILCDGFLDIGGCYAWSWDARKRFVGDLAPIAAGGNRDVLADARTLTSGTSWRNEVQAVSISHAVGGTFMLGYNGTKTPAIRFDATAAAVQAALEAVPGLAGNVACGGGPLAAGGEVIIIFQNALGNRDVSSLTIDCGGLVDPDWRPLDEGLPTDENKIVQLPYYYNYWIGTLTLLDKMRVTRRDVSTYEQTVSPSFTADLRYRLYPGGKSYPAKNVSGTNQYLIDWVQNPGGIFVRNDPADLVSTVPLTGTLMTLNSSADVNLRGRGVTVNPLRLPPWQNSACEVQLPVIVSLGDVRVHPGCKAEIHGRVIALDQFEVSEDVQDRNTGIDLYVQGSVIAQHVLIRGRTEWNHSDDWWQHRYQDFQDQLDGRAPIKSFPMWLKVHEGLNSAPGIRLDKPAAPETILCPDFQNPIFAYHTENGKQRLAWRIVAAPRQDTSQ